MKQMSLILLGLVLLINGTAQNNAIFTGGQGAGWKSNYAGHPSGDAIFAGGSGHGWSKALQMPLLDSLFRGGNGDGYTKNESPKPLLDSLFMGGVGDGYAKNESPIPLLDSLFKGGDGDGWFSLQKNTERVDSIFKGGEGDGWASTYLPLSPLPVRLLSFTGEQKNSVHILRWETSSETNSHYFNVERQVQGSSAFQAIGRVAAAGNSSAARQYSLTDFRPVLGNNFYRLQMVDLDGTYSYSNIVLLKMLSDKSLLTVFPNPTADLLYVRWSGKLNGKNIQVSILDAAGKKSGTSTYPSDQAQLSVPVGHLSSGMYILQLVCGDQTEQIKFMKH
ncbi:MAG TPA: T9SS type A sorting domain-containing protein [Ferruginibacter sp.]|nr:T9SS type A sorting domain-containing protein [Ferruginibacter sp.]